MANYRILLSDIEDAIKENGHGDITGPILQDILKAVVNSLSKGFIFAGVATPEMNPGNPDEDLFYLAFEAGDYVNFTGEPALGEGHIGIFTAKDTVPVTWNFDDIELIPDSFITANKIADGSITDGKLSNNSITTAKIADGAIATAKIADGAITTVKIANGAIGSDQVSSISGSKIGNFSITSPKLATDCVTTEKISNNSVTMDKLGIVARNTINGKQDAITDLATIRSGAEAGATAVQPEDLEEALGGKQDTLTAGTNITIENNVISATGSGGTSNYNDLSNKPSVNGVTLSGNKTSSDLGLQPTISDLATIRSGAGAGATAVQPATLTQGLAAKQDIISDLATIRSGAGAGATAVQPATLTQGLATKQNTISDLDTIRSGAGAGATAVQPAALTQALATKQDTLTAGTNITIENNVISATGSGGTSNYNDLSNKPSINNITLSGNKTSSDLGLQPTITDLSTIRSGASAGATAVQPDTLEEALGTKQNVLTAGSIGSSLLADGAVTADKIASNAVTTDKIANLSITLAKIANGAIGTLKIADNSITEAKLQTTLKTKLFNYDIVGGYSYAQMKSFVDSGALLPQHRYLMYFQTKTNPNNNAYQAVTGNLWTIVLTAISAREFAPEVEVYSYSRSQHSDVSKWKAWYSFDNNTNNFPWADPNGQGVIYRLIDEYGNDCPYDFKSIQFKVDPTGASQLLLDWAEEAFGGFGDEPIWMYTFSYINSSGEVSDLSLDGNFTLTDDTGTVFGCHGNVIEPTFTSHDDVQEEGMFMYLARTIFAYGPSSDEFFGCNNNRVKASQYPGAVTYIGANSCEYNEITPNGPTFIHSELRGSKIQGGNYLSISGVFTNLRVLADLSHVTITAPDSDPRSNIVVLSAASDSTVSISDGDVIVAQNSQGDSKVFNPADLVG